MLWEQRSMENAMKNFEAANRGPRITFALIYEAYSVPVR